MYQTISIVVMLKKIAQYHHNETQGCLAMPGVGKQNAVILFSSSLILHYYGGP